MSSTRRLRSALFALGLFSLVSFSSAQASPVSDIYSDDPSIDASGLGGLLGGLGGTLGGLGSILGSLGRDSLTPTPGTVSEEGFIEHQGLARRFILIRPETAIAGAPVLVLLHARGLAPENMANLVRAGRLAADYGAWVYLPQARGGSWNSDPVNLLGGADDVGFISDLIDSAITTRGVDAQRVYAAGYSNGGAMAERLGCQLSAKIAGIAFVAAELSGTLAAVCQPVHAIPVLAFNGTSDPVVPYSGLPGLSSPPNTVAFWAARSGCTAGQTSVSTLPDLDPRDGTRVTLTQYTGCPAGTGARLYTITGGGHTWPSSVYPGFTFELGRTTQDIDATLELWGVLTPFSLPGIPAH